ncbi:MAG: RNA methyltransferase [Candidatus Thorarchaeota archaeon]
MDNEHIYGFPEMVVVLVGPENPGNVGFTVRVMANFGVTKLRIVGDDFRKNQYAQIMAVHALDILENAEIHPSLDSALEDIEAAWAATARRGSNHNVTRAVIPLVELPDPKTLPARVALVFGRESTGLVNEELALCDIAFYIPTSRDYPSMNLSHAVAVTLYELYRKYAKTPPPRPTEIKPATKEERELVAKFFDELIELTSIKDFKKPIAKQVFRNLMNRAFMTGREIATLTGTIRKITELIENDE